MPLPAVTEAVYDAAVRVITRDELPDDGMLLEKWHAEATARTTRDIALEVIRQVAEHGYGRRCVD